MHNIRGPYKASLFSKAYKMTKDSDEHSVHIYIKIKSRICYQGVEINCQPFFLYGWQKNGTRFTTFSD